MLVIFDWDGVFVDSFEQLFGICCVAQKQVWSGRSFIRDDFRYIHSFTLVDLARRIGMREDLIETFSSNFFNLQKADHSMSPFFSGIIEATKYFNRKSKLAIVSSNSQWEIERYLKKADIQNLFQTIHVGTNKLPKCEKIVQTMEDLAETRNTTFMVGDCRSDISQGKKAGVRTIAVTWGYQPRKSLILEDPEFIVDTVDELIEIIDKVQ